RPGDDFAENVEHRQNAVPAGLRALFDLALEFGADTPVLVDEECLDQAVLRSEISIKRDDRCLGFFEHTVDPDSANCLAVEQFGGGHQAFARWLGVCLHHEPTIANVLSPLLCLRMTMRTSGVLV